MSQVISAPFKNYVKYCNDWNPSLLYEEGNIFNFGYVSIEDGRENGNNGSEPHLIADIRGENGVIRPGSRLDLIPK